MYKRLFTIVLCFLLLWCFVIPAGATEAEVPETIPKTRLEISTVEEFLEFAENCRLDSYSKNLEVYLEADLDLSGYNFAGIPTFSGTFWGKRHDISGVSITADGSYRGLFRYVTQDAIVRDLTVIGEITPGGSQGNVGGIAGSNAGAIVCCNFLGTVSGGDAVGAIAGENTVTGVIENCSAEGSVNGDHFVGGIAGNNQGVIRDCENRAQINTTPQENEVALTDITLSTLTNSEAANTATDIGGIAGISSGVIRTSKNSGSIGYRHMGYNIGGIAGTQSGYIDACENFGRIEGRKEVGGIVGQMEPITQIEFTEDTLQILKDQLNTMSGMVNQASGNVQSNASQITNQIALLQEQTKTAKDAVSTLLPGSNDSGIPDADTILAAQNTLSKTMEAMPSTVKSISSAAQSTVSTLSRDLKAISGQIGVMGNTLNNAAENLGGSVEDISDQDTPELLTGKVENCKNTGSVLADLNVGGIAGAMAMENDMDIMEDLESIGDTSLNFASQIRAVVLNCENNGVVTGKKQNAGGIVGWQSLGLLKHCINTGFVDAQNANHVGGVCGTSIGYVRNCYANCEISGDTYIGGIAGSGTIVTDSAAQVKLAGGRERVGGILGWMDSPLTETENPILGNYYLPVEVDCGAIDGISYAGLAEPLKLSEFLSIADLPPVFETAKIRFHYADGTMTEVKVPAGGTLKESQIPQIPQKEGYAACWDGLSAEDLSDILFDMNFEAVYTSYSTTIASAERRSDGRPLVLLEGSFTDSASVSTMQTEDAPALQKNETLLETWEITTTEPGKTVRFLLPETETETALYIFQNNGWQKADAKRDGSYLVFPMEGVDTRIALVQIQKDYSLWMIAGVGLIALIVVAFIIHKKRKGKKIAAADSQQ